MTRAVGEIRHAQNVVARAEKKWKKKMTSGLNGQKNGGISREQDRSSTIQVGSTKAGLASTTARSRDCAEMPKSFLTGLQFDKRKVSAMASNDQVSHPTLTVTSLTGYLDRFACLSFTTL